MATQNLRIKDQPFCGVGNYTFGAMKIVFFIERLSPFQDITDTCMTVFTLVL